VHVLGIDAGGSKTVCQVGHPDGGLIREVRGAGANLQSSGELQVEKVLHDVMSEALSGIDGAPAAVCIGIAGVGRPHDARVMRAMVSRLCRGSRSLIVNDALIALEAGAPGRPGIVLIAGTGSIAYGRDASGNAARAGGWGHLLGDEGSGFWLGRQALRAVLRAADQRGERTALAGRLLTHFGVTREQDLVKPVYDGGMKPRSVAALAPIVAEAADAGDAVAGRIVDVGADELAASAASVGRRLGMVDQNVPLLFAGSIFRTMARVRARVIERLATVLPHAHPALLGTEPASGARRLAAELLQGEVRVPVYLDTTH
jgi:N-acetylglucosamine kinase-like BadF-type ATPase